VRLKANRTVLSGDGEDVALVTVEALDDRGRPVPTADDQIEFAIRGPARILGVGNGNPSSHESDKEPRRKLFNGLALAIVQSTGGAGTIELTASGKGLKSCTISLSVKESPRRPSVP